MTLLHLKIKKLQSLQPLQNLNLHSGADPLVRAGPPGPAEPVRHPQSGPGAFACQSPHLKALPLLFLLALTATAQQQSPHIGFVYPAGIRQGASLEITIGGQFLTGADAAYLSGPGIQATVSKYIRPLTPGQANQLREQLQMLRDKKDKTADDQKTILDLQAKLVDFVRRPSSPAIAETVLLQVTVAPDAAPGVRELRLGTTQGLTNPLTLTIGQLPEYSRPPARVLPAFSTNNGGTPPAHAAREPEPPMEIALPAVVNGQMMPGIADRYRFAATKGQHLVIAARARELVPYVSDAVPGWFQAVLTLRDAKGAELLSADHFRFHPDPVLSYEVPADGAYVLEIHDSIFRGREDFVYRITLGELPFLTGIFPLGGRPGSRTPLELLGWNLPARTLVPDPKAKGMTAISVQQAGRVSNELPYAIDAMPSLLAKDNHRREKAQKLRLPIVVDGRVAQPGESEFFRFDGRPGEEIVAEVQGRRLDSPLDSILRLTDAAGRELALNDDCEDKGSGLLTHHADSRIAFKLTSKGTYYLQLGDAQRKGGTEYAYRLRLSHPEPDFELRVVPSSLNIRAGTTVPITVYALRRDGFSGEIALHLKDVPQGFSLGGAAVPEGQDRVRLTLTVPPSRVDIPMAIQLEGRAQTSGRELHHLAIPAEDMMQAFAYHHLVAERDWMVRVIGAGQARMNLRAANEKPVRLPQGGEVSMQVIVPPRLMDQVKLALNEPLEGMSIQSVTPGGNGLSVVLRADPAKLKAGLRGNLIVDAFVERPGNGNAAQRANRRQLLGTLPAIPFEIVGASPPRP